MLIFGLIRKSLGTFYSNFKVNLTLFIQYYDTRYTFTNSGVDIK